MAERHGSAIDAAARSNAASRLAHRFLTLLVYGAVALIPITFSTAGDDSFRFPQLLLLRAFGILTGVALVMIALTPDRDSMLRFLSQRLEVRLAGAIVLWFAITAAFSTNRGVSLGTFTTVALAALLFVGAVYAARYATMWVLLAMAVPAVVNAVVMILEESRIWHPFGNAEFGHAANGALLGNPNDVGTFLCIPALLLIVIAVLSRGRARVGSALAALIVVAGLIASITVTALAAFAAGLMIFGLMHTRRRTAIILLATGAIAAATAVKTVPALQVRTAQMRSALATGEINRVLTGRLSAYTAALEMARAHPLLGAGPGTFEWNYVEYRLRAEERYPALTAWPGEMGGRVMFAQTHNDHLQILAETGVIGYALFAAALVVVAITGRRARAGNDGGDLRGRFARAAAVPAVAAVAILALAQFPLQIAAPSVTLLVLAAILRVWGENEWAAS